MLRSSGLALRLLLPLRLLQRRGRRTGPPSAAGTGGNRRMRGRTGGRVAAPEADDGGRDEDTRVGAGNYADHHREREGVQHFPAEKEQREGGQKRRARRDDR